MQRKPEWYNKKWIGNLITVAFGVILFVLLEHIGDIWHGIGAFFKFLTPVVIGLCIAYVLDPLAKVFENRIFDGVKKEGARRILSVTFSLILLLLLLVVLMVSLIPQLADSVNMFINNLDGYSKSFTSFIDKVQNMKFMKGVNLTNVTNSMENVVNGIIKSITDNKAKILETTYGVGSSVMNGALGFILAIYFLYGKRFVVDGVKRFLKAILTERQYTNIRKIFVRSNKIMVRYISFDLIDGLIVGIVNWVFMLITDMQYSVLISVVVGITNLAPTFGPMVGAVIGGFILLLANPLDALIFLIFTAVLQTIDGYVLKPKLFGDSLGVSAVLIIIFIIVGGKMFGVMGVLLSIPCAGILDFLYHEYFIERIEERKNRREEAEKEKYAAEEKLKAKTAAENEE
ncbi:MAG: AI-2E family transporter [Lachnospiraceae bacterium]|nr:AI-2E family transporter [Lachnospiraceae bacterium]